MRGWALSPLSLEELICEVFEFVAVACDIVNVFTVLLQSVERPRVQEAVCCDLH